MAGDLYKLIKNFLSLAVGQVIVRIFNVVATLCAVRMLGPSSYGVLSSGLAYALVFSVTANMGLGDYLVLNIARSSEDTGALLGDMLLAKILFFPLALIGFVLLVLANPQHVALYALLLCYSIMYSYFMLICAAFRGLEQMEYQTLLMLVQAALVVLGSVGAIWLTHSPTFVALGYLVASTAGVGVGYWLLHKRGIRLQYRWNPLRWKSLIQAGLPFGLIFIYGMAQDRLPSIFLPFLASDEVAGWYNAVYNVIVILTTIPGITMGAVFPLLARKSRDGADKTLHIATLLTKYTNVVSVGVAIVLYIAAPTIVLVLFDEAYLPSVDILRVMAISLPFLFLSATLISVLGAVGEQHSGARYSGYVLLATAPLNWFVIRCWGYQSGALAYVLNNILLTIVFVGLSVKKIGSIRTGSAFIRPAIAGGAAIALAWIGRTWPFYVLVPLVVLWYGICLIITQTITSFEFDMARSFLKTGIARYRNVTTLKPAKPK
ncbi:MAG: flippase [Anaerolineae bacterium]|nr:flippase [Anaerolineae bacterium]